jgi:hypothetical protein
MVKDFIGIMLECLLNFYETCDIKDDLEILKEDLFKLITTIVVRNQVYQIIMVFLRL